jgi:hypothetical protein
LNRYLDRLVLDGGPGEEARSRVFTDADGEVRGFIGIWPRRMVLGGRVIEAAAAGSHMVDQPEKHPTAGVRLLRAFLNGPQQFSFSETANAISQRLWEKAGAERLAAASLDWLRVLRPAGLAVAVTRGVFAPAGWLRPVAAGADRLFGRRLQESMLRLAAPAGFTDAPADSAEVAALIRQFSDDYELRPDWQSPALDVLLDHAESKERFGELQRRVVYSRGGTAVGCYLYYARRGDIARVLQVMARPDAIGPTLDSLFQHAAGLGCVGVRGRVEPALLDTLIARRCLLFHVSAMMMHARDKMLLAEIRRSRALLTGLAGESWTRLIGGKFA